MPAASNASSALTLGIHDRFAASATSAIPTSATTRRWSRCGSMRATTWRPPCAPSSRRERRARAMRRRATRRRGAEGDPARTQDRAARAGARRRASASTARSSAAHGGCRRRRAGSTRTTSRATADDASSAGAGVDRATAGPAARVTQRPSRATAVPTAASACAITCSCSRRPASRPRRRSASRHSCAARSASPPATAAGRWAPMRSCSSRRLRASPHIRTSPRCSCVSAADDITLHLCRRRSRRRQAGRRPVAARRARGCAGARRRGCARRHAPGARRVALRRETCDVERARASRSSAVTPTRRRASSAIRSPAA